MRIITNLNHLDTFFTIFEAKLIIFVYKVFDFQ